MSKEFFQTSNAATSYKKFRPEMPKKCVEKMLNFLAETYELNECVAADVGCGSGQSTFPVAVHLKKVIGIDSSEAQLKEASEADDPRKCNVVFKLSSAEHLPLPDSSVHLIYCVFSAHWFNMPAFLKEADRVLMPGGTLAFCGTDYIMDFNAKWNEEALKYHEQLLEKTKNYWDDKTDQMKNFYIDLQSPYPAFIRDHSVTVYETITVKKFVDRLTTVSSFGQYLADKPNEAMEDIQSFQNQLMRLLESTASPEETTLNYGFHYVMLFCKKSL